MQTKKLKVGILGAGALGSLVGAYLSTTHDLTLFGRPNHMETISKEGLKINGFDLDSEKNIQVRAVSELCDEHFDLVFVGVKSYDTENLFNYLDRQRITFDFIASLQNGLKDNYLISRCGLEKVIGCVVDRAVQITSPSNIYYSNSGSGFFGTLKKERHPRKMNIAESLALAFKDQGMVTGVDEKMETITWYKFMNCVPGYAVHGAMNFDAARAFTNPFTVDLLLQAFEETEIVTLAEKIELKQHPLLPEIYLTNPRGRKEWIKKVGEIISSLSNPPVASLVQDLRRGKVRTEADDTLGVFLEKVRTYELRTPTISCCYQMVKAREWINQENRNLTSIIT